MVAAAAVGGAAVLIWHRIRDKTAAKLPAEENPDVNMDIGQAVHVDAWAPDGSTTIKYRGAAWQARFKGHGNPAAGRYVIRAIEGLQAFAERNPTGRTQPGLHHQGQHPAHRRWHSVLSGDRRDACQLRLQQLHRRHHTTGANDLALGHRPDGTGPHVRRTRHHQHVGGRGPGRSGTELGRQGVALRDQGSDAARRHLARDAGADHGRA